MALYNRATTADVDFNGVAALSTNDLAELIAFYQESYPGNWFDPRMLETQQYFGIRDGGHLVSAGGVHVYSPQYRVAVLGNIATHADHRGRGYGKAVTARICQSVCEVANDIGLNVKADNWPALACYERLGFETIATYEEFVVRRKPET